MSGENKPKREVSTSMSLSVSSSIESINKSKSSPKLELAPDNKSKQNAKLSKKITPKQLKLKPLL